MTLRISKTVHDLFEQDRRLAVLNNRSEFSLGLLLEDENLIIDLIPGHDIHNQFCQVEDNNGGVAEIPEGHAGGALYHLAALPEMSKKSEEVLNQRLRTGLSDSHSLSVDAYFLQAIKRFNMNEFELPLEKLWTNYDTQLKIEGYSEQGRVYLVPCFARPQDILVPEELKQAENFISKGLPTLDELCLQRAIGAPQTVVFSGYLQQVAGQDYVYATGKPYGVKRRAVTVPERFMEIVTLMAFAALSGAAKEIESVGRSEIGFDYQVI
ncbi:hypothetical protein CL619_03835 [archaeon]|nr:hypothetical protein [archaeon]